MARGINKVILIGNLGNDPDVRYTQGGAPVANITLATTDAWRDKATGDTKERTEWHRLVFFGRLAEIVSEYLRKGARIYVEGRLQTREWEDRDGNKRYTTEIIANEMQMLGGKEERGGEARPREAAAPPGQEAPAAAPDAAPAGAAPAGPAASENDPAGPPAGGGKAPARGDDLTDDDIPF